MKPSIHDKPLHGRRLIWAGTTKSGSGWVDALRDAGATVVRWPLIETQAVRLCEADKGMLARMAQYDWVVFTSAAAVRTLPEDVSLAHCNIAVVGPSTGRAVEARMGRVSLVPEQTNAEGVVSALLKTDKKPLRVLFVKGRQALRTVAERLREAGHVVDTVTIYTTVRRQKEQVGAMPDADGVLLGSPSVVSALVNAVAPMLLRELRCDFFCLGQTTLAALQGAGGEGVALETVSPEGIVDLVRIGRGV